MCQPLSSNMHVVFSPFFQETNPPSDSWCTSPISSPVEVEWLRVELAMIDAV